MPTYWQITYRFKEAIHVVDTPKALPALALTFQYDANEMLIESTHSLSLPDGAEEAHAIVASESALKPVWEAMSFSYGVPVANSVLRVARTSPVSNGQDAVAKFTIRVSMSADATVVKPLELARLNALARDSDRLSVWLRLANEARESRIDAEALRHYFLILEDLNNKYGISHPSYHDVKLIRDFVSHGKPLDNNNIPKLVQRETGQGGVTQYDPHDAKQAEMVRFYRVKARDMVICELSKRI